MRGDARRLATLTTLVAFVSCVRAPSPSNGATPAAPELPPVTLVPHDTLPTGTIRGRLSIDHPALSLAAATVELPDAALSARVDSAGAFELRGVPSGRQRLRARRFGCTPTVGSIDVPARGGAVMRVLLEIQTFCLDHCPPKAPRAFGRIEAIP